MGKGEPRFAGFDIPHLHGAIARRGGEDILGCGVEEDVSDFPVTVSGGVQEGLEPNGTNLI